MPLFLMRHGRTKLSGTFLGTSNPSLNRRGMSEVRAAARALSRYSLDLCYSSPQRRAKETSAIVCRSHPPLRQTSDPLLKEIRFGAWEGLRFSQVEAKWPSLAQAWVKNPADGSRSQRRIFSFPASACEALLAKINRLSKLKI